MLLTASSAAAVAPSSEDADAQGRPGQKKTANQQPGKAVANRQRKPHRKSRLGCQNCKIRSVKCDEAKPSCQRCLASGWICVYSSISKPAVEPPLQLAHVGAFQVHLDSTDTVPPPIITDIPPPDPHVRLPAVSPKHRSLVYYELNSQEFQALKTFETCILDQIGSPSMRPTYHMMSPVLGKKSPYLIHVYLMLSYLYSIDQMRSQSVMPSSQMQAALAFHWHQATILHKRSIAGTGHTASERDVIWAAAFLLAGGTTGYLETYDPALHWPNNSQQNTEPKWLRLSISRRALWQVLKPNNSDSIYTAVSAPFKYANPRAPIPHNFFPEAFMSLFQITAGSVDTGNPYFCAVTILAQILPDRCEPWNVFRFTALAEYLDDKFCKLLGLKDPRALLLLAWWWAKLCAIKVVFIPRRATIEGRAICLYLLKEHRDDARIQELLKYPRAVFAALERSAEEATTRSTYISDPRLANTKARSSPPEHIVQGPLEQLDSATTRCNSIVFL